MHGLHLEPLLDAAAERLLVVQAAELGQHSVLVRLVFVAAGVDFGDEGVEIGVGAQGALGNQLLAARGALLVPAAEKRGVGRGSVGFCGAWVQFYGVWMGFNGILWGPDGILWDFVMSGWDPTGSGWDPTESYGILRGLEGIPQNPMGSYRTLWDPTGSGRDPTESYGVLLNSMGSYGVCIGSCGITWDPMGSGWDLNGILWGVNRI